MDRHTYIQDSCFISIDMLLFKKYKIGKRYSKTANTVDTSIPRGILLELFCLTTRVIVINLYQYT